jgi:xanthine dehydrogenase small subunit
MSDRTTIDFTLNGERVSLSDEDPTRTVLTWLREDRRLTGTKEGCAEGDCGACTVVLAERNADGALRYVAANACILFLGALDGRELITVEGLKPLYGGALHPVQQAMVECHGSQCGFCTPGFVMALYAHQKSGGSPERASLCDAIAGNLCRCTGYRSILEAGQRARALSAAACEQSEDQGRMKRLASLPAGSTRLAAQGRSFYAPATASELAGFLAEHPAATLLAGGTDLGLLVTKAHRDFVDVAYLGKVAEMKTIRQTPEAVEIGGAVPFGQAHAALASIHRDLGELVRRLGAVQVRSVGTLAGNIANGSPIGDSMPALIALGAELVLRRGDRRRTVALERFYTGYRKSVLQPGEFILSVRIPRLAEGARFAAYKLSRRFDQDISAVCAAFHVGAQGAARFGFGGMAATPSRAPLAEAAYVANAAAGIDPACAALAKDFAPLSDHRGSDWYRLTAAQNLLRKFHAETENKAGNKGGNKGFPTRVLQVESHFER